MTSNMNSTDPQQVAHKSKPLPPIVSSSLIAPMFNAEPITSLTQMEQHLENLLAQLEKPTFDDLDQVIELLNRLNDILCPSKNIHAYEDYLKLNFERIVVALCDKQLQLVVKNHVRNLMPNNLEIVARVQRILDHTTNILTSLLQDYQLDISSSTLDRLFSSMFHYLLLHRPTSTICPNMIVCPCGINGQMAYYFMKNILSGGSNADSNGAPQPKIVSPLQIGLLNVTLYLLRKTIVDSMQLNMELNMEYAKFIDRCNAAVDTLACLIECESGIFTGFVFQQNTQHLSEFIYELYAMYELCIQIVNCPYLNNVHQVLQSIEYYVVCICGSLGDSVWIHFELVDKEIRDLKLNLEQVELFKFMAIGGHTREPKNIPKNIKRISGQNYVEIQQCESNLAILTIPGTDSNVTILDHETHGHPILDQTKIAAPKSALEQKSETEEGELVKSFEILKVPESPEVTKNTFEIPETEESDHSAIESTVTTSSPSIENLSKEDKQKMYKELQKMQQDLFKLEQLLSELLHKLTNQKIN